MQYDFVDVRADAPPATALVLYHAGCLDGAAAALCAAYRLGESARFKAVRYGEDPPPREAVEGLDVYILDFAYPPNMLEFLWGDAPNQVVTLDHHKSAAEARGLDSTQVHKLRSLQGKGCGTYDFQYYPASSGAMLAQVEFKSPAYIRNLCLYVEDYDLWFFHLPATRKVCAYLDTIPKTFACFHAVALDLANERGRLRILTAGEALLRARRREVEYAVKTARFVEMFGFPCYVCNTTVHRNDVGEALTTAAPERIAVVWSHNAAREEIRVSFRSTGDLDVTPLAARFNGGGHRNAAGATIQYQADRQRPELLPLLFGEQ